LSGDVVRGQNKACKMDEKQLNFRSLKEFWLTEAEEALLVAEHLVEKGDFSYSLFFGHLAVEKLLKALYVVRCKEHAPLVHNLLRLAKSAGLKPDSIKSEALIKITAFNIESRYPDVKRAFRKKCTAEFTRNQMQIIKEIFQWLKSLLP
jgi:HEPN domain-containing protein